MRNLVQEMGRSKVDIEGKRDKNKELKIIAMEIVWRIRGQRF